VTGQNRARVLELATINSFYESGVGNPLDAAICQQAGNPAQLVWRKLADLPFDFERRRAAVLVERGGQRLLIVKGAPEALLDRCDRIERAGDSPALDPATRAQLDAMHDARAANGERLLAVAWRAWSGDPRALTVADEAGLTFAGYCAFLDPPKQSAREAIARLQGLGVRVKVISGDAAPVVRHLVTTLELDCKGLLTGEEISRLSAAALRGKVRKVDLFARVSPDQKLRIIRALSQSGHTVGYMGDGINDAPAIKAADAGMSVDGATDVARAAADMILLSNDLNVVADGVMEGRRTYANIIKYVRMGTSSNFGNMLSMALATLVIPFLPMTAIQILLNNLLYDFSQLGIPFDNVDAAETARPHNWSITAIERFTAFMGPLSSVFDIATFGLLLLVFKAAPAEFRTAWFVESMLTQILVIFVIRTQARPWRSTPHKALAITSLAALGIALVLALGPWAGVFGFAPMPLHLLGAVVALALAYLACAEAIKRLAMTGRA
jgi:Mg2+-importing ATPase